MSDVQTTDTAFLERLRFAMVQHANPALWQDVSVTGERDWLVGDMLVRFEKELLGEQLGSTEYDVDIGFPATAWQHFKSDHMPRWFVRRWPTRFANHTVRLHLDVLAAFPAASIKTPPHLRGAIVTPVYRARREETL